MKPTTEILARISQNSLANKEEVFTKLYRYLLRPDIYFVAYKNLYANNGAATKGVNEDTADGFSEAKIDSIIKALADETYQPMPVRRTYIQKKNNRKKLRPLGIPTFTDKLVQEVLRMILEAVYEPKIAPQCRNQQSAGLLVSPRESPRGMGKRAERAGGRDAPATQPYGKRKALFLLL
nr:hypothetical protein [Gemmiger formicilis]